MEVGVDTQRWKHFRKSKAQLVDELIALERRLAGQNDGRRDEGVGGERPFTLVDNFVSNSPSMFSIKDAEGRYVMVNNQWQETVNATLEEAIGGCPEALLPEELSNQSIGHDGEARESLKPVVKEETLVIANEPHVFQTVKFPLFGEKGEFQGLATIATDITALKTSQEKALQKIESKFRSAIESNPNGVAIFDKNDRFVLCNRAFHRNIEKLALILVPGTSFEEILCAVAAAGIEPDVRKDPEGYVRRRLDMRKRRVPFVQHMTEKDRWTIIHDYEMADGNIFHVRTDITEQKRAEEALRESERRFKNFAETTSDRFWEMDENFKFTFNIDAMDGKYPIDPERFIGFTRWEAAGADPKREEKWRRHLEDHLAHRPYRGFEFTISGDGGELLHLSVSGSPVFDNTGAFKGYRGSTLNISDRKRGEEELQKSELKFRNAIENLQEGFALFDRSDHLVIWNDKYSELLALNKASVKVGAAFEDLLRENVKLGRVIQSAGRTEQFIRERIEHHKNPSGPFELTLSNGKSLLASESKTPDGGTYITLMDITKLKQTEQQAREREVELFNSRRLNVLGEMAAAVAHELNQPLAVISSYAQGLAEKLRLGTASLDDLLKPVKKIVDQADRAGGIITGIRSLIGKQETHKSSIDLNAAIEEVLVLLQSECEELRINVKVDLDQGLPRVLANKIQVQQVVLNLARNAIEAISEGPCASPRLIVRSLRADGGNVEVAVRDSGPGFSAKEDEAIFEPFHTKKPHGLGLGLSICRSITEAYGGRIWADPASAKGATVRFSLPVAEERQPENA
ncbi:MAG: PAS-domain containing protein [Rhodospirillales bacterium]|nr:PAS-domain containing protein [Rhodospirillales bacterium]